MGSLRHFNVKELIENFGIKYFIETGTGMGDSLSYADGFPFDYLYSIEIHQEVYNQVKGRFDKSLRIKVINNCSEEALGEILKTLPKDRPILFWLDAHFPGADYGFSNYGDEKNNNVRLPLEKELRVINKFRKNSNDVILIDDLRIYEDGSYQRGNLPSYVQALPPEKRHIGFVFELFGDSHDIRRDYANEGYIVLSPKDAK